MKVFSFLIKKIAENSKKQFRNAHSMVIAARIISCNLKVDWNIQNQSESKIEVSWSWSNWKIALIIFAQPFFSPLLYSCSIQPCSLLLLIFILQRNFYSWNIQLLFMHLSMSCPNRGSAEIGGAFDLWTLSKGGDVLNKN